MSAVSQEAAKLGAEELDKRVPGWFKKINLETLDIGSSHGYRDVEGRVCGCICSQLDFLYGLAHHASTKGDWIRGFRRIFRKRNGDIFDAPKLNPVRLGFTTDGKEASSFRALTLAWKREIKARLAA